MKNPYHIIDPAIVSFSGGRSSGYMLKHILDAHGGTLPDDVKVVFSNTGREMPETLDFVQECGERWGVHVVWLEYDPESEFSTKIVSHNEASRNGEPFKKIIDKKGFLPNPVTRFCTVELKIRRSYNYAFKMLGWPKWVSVIGFRADEMRRVEKMANSRERWTNAAPMAEAGVTKRDVQAFWDRQPFDLRLPNVNGSTPLGNCDLCFLKGEATIRGIIREKPDLAQWWIEAEAEAEARASKPDGAKFRIDRAPYASMLEDSKTQIDWIAAQEESLDCACTD
jgi:3'-phosphoadenosine 5'-phosphosulfate sulfotransferase (PAPS reductase)/FAD synthetase